MPKSAPRHLAPGVDLAVSCRQAFGLVSKTVSGLLLAVTATLMVGSAVSIFVFNMGISPVLTGSMRGTFDPGAVVLTKPVPVETVQVGDVLVFQPPGTTDSYTHRVVTVTADEQGPVITTKGDANPVIDPWKAQLSGPVAQEVVTAVPHVGHAVVAIQSGNLRPFLLAIAGLVFTVMGVRAALGPPSDSRTSVPAPSYAG